MLREVVTRRGDAIGPRTRRRRPGAASERRTATAIRDPSRHYLRLRSRDLAGRGSPRRSGRDDQDRGPRGYGRGCGTGEEGRGFRGRPTSRGGLVRSDLLEEGYGFAIGTQGRSRRCRREPGYGPSRRPRSSPTDGAERWIAPRSCDDAVRRSRSDSRKERRSTRVAGRSRGKTQVRRATAGEGSPTRAFRRNRPQSG